MISLFCPCCLSTIFVCCVHLFRAAHYPIGRLASTTPGYAKCFFSLPLPIPWQILIHLIPHLKKIWRVKLYFSKELLVIIFTSYGKIHNFKKKNCPGLFDPQPLMVLITIYLVRLLFRNVLVQCLFFLTLAFYFVALAMNESSSSYRLLDWAGHWKTEWVKPS